MRKELLLIILFFTLVAGVLFRQWVFAGKVPIAADLQANFYEPWKSEHPLQPYKPLGFDDIRIFYPQKIFAVEELKQGRLPVWNPYEFSGNVHLANSQTATFYPLTLFYLFLSPIFVWSLSSFILPIMAGLFSYLFLRQCVGKIAALFGATAFALSGFLIVRLEDGVVPGHSAVWLPLALYFIENYAQSKKKLTLFFCVLALSMSVLAGWFQFSFYVLVVTLLYALYRRVPLTAIFVIFSSTVLITTPHWLPAVQALQFSPRGQGGTLDLGKHLVNVGQLITYLVPNFFGHPVSGNYFGKSEYKEAMMFFGLIPLLFAVVAAVKSLARRPVGFFLVLALVTIPFGLDLPGVALILSKIPLISSFLPDRIFFIASFSFCILCAFGCEFVLSHSEKAVPVLKKTLLATSAILFMIIIAAGLIYLNEKVLLPLTRFSFFQKGIERYLLIFLQSAREGLISLIFISLTVWLFAKKIIGVKLFLYLSLILAVVSSLMFADRYLYFSDKRNLFPDHPVINFLQKNTISDYSRFVALGDARFTSNTATFYHLFDTEGVDALYPSWYGEFANFAQTKGESMLPQDRISTWFAPEIYSVKDWSSPFVVNYLKILGVKYIVTRDNFVHPPADFFPKIFTLKNWVVYQFVNPLPKATFVSRFDIISDKKTMLNRLFDRGFDPKTTVLLVSDPKLPNTTSTGSAQILSYKPDEIRIRSQSAGPGLVFVNDTFFPNWKASVDGQASPVLLADYAFRAVPVTAGQHEIVMYYSFLP